MPVPVPVPVPVGLDSVVVAAAVLGGLVDVVSAAGVHTWKVAEHSPEVVPQVLVGGHFHSLLLTEQETEGPGSSPQVGVFGGMLASCL